MERQLAYIETIKSLQPIIDAERIELATILGWTVVVKKNQFKIGDKVVYCEVDSLLPNLPPFSFLEPKKFRIKIQKIRGAYSYGIAFPLSVINEVDPTVDIAQLKVGDDVTETLKITKYESASEKDQDQFEDTQTKLTYLEKKLRYYKWKLFGYKPVKNPGGFPTHLVPKTDETRVQKMQGLLSAKKGTLCQISEKLEGSSFSAVYTTIKGNWLSNLFNIKQDQFLVCSRNTIVFNSLKQKTYPKHRMAVVAQQENLYKTLKRLGKNIAIQGECIGANSGGGDKIQGNIYKLNNYALYIFRVWNVDTQSDYSYHDMKEICAALGLRMAPVVSENHILSDSIPEYVELSKGNSKIKSSMVNSTCRREGIVIRSLDGSFSFKSINPEYLLHSEL